MNKRLVIRLLGAIMLIEALAMLPSSSKLSGLAR